MKIDFSSVDAAFLPDVFFTKILLETSNTPENGPRAMPKRRTLAGTPERKKRKVNEGGALKVSLSITIMDHIDENGLTSWFYNEDLTKYLKIKVIQSKSPKITNALMKNNFSILDNNKFDNLHDQKVITVKKDYDQDITDFISFDTQQNKRVFSINYTTSFTVNDLEPPHLSYFAFCYLDLKALVEAYHMEFLLPDSNSNIVRGNLTGDKVIEKSTLQLETYAFFLEREGTVWTGATHRMPKSNRWMTQKTHTTASKYLIRRKMSNNKIQDFREVDAVKLMDFDLTPAINIFSTIEKGKTGSQRVIQNPPDVYFSDAFISYALDGKSKFLFQMDYNRIIRDKTQFGSIIDKSSNPDALDQIYKNSIITSLKILRRRVRFGVGHNRLGSPVFGQIITDPLEPVEAIVMSGDTKGNHLNGTESTLGSIKEVLLGSQTQFRTFTITDKSGDEITDGYYQYGVEIEFRDGTIDFLNRQLQRLMNIKRDMNLYYSIASAPGFYNKASGKFTQKLKRYYKTYKQDQLPWIKSIAFFMDVITSLTFVGDAKSMAKRFFAFTSPNSGTLEGINSFLSLIEMLESKLTYILGSKIHLQTPGNQQKRMIHSKLKASMISITRWFNETWDSNERPDLGLDYLSLPDISDSVGLKGITANNFKERIKRENALYWTDTNLLNLQTTLGATAINGITDENKEILNLSSVEYGYLTPGTIYAGTGLTDNRLDQGQAAFDAPKFTAVSTALIASSTSQFASAYPADGISTTAMMPKVGDQAMGNILGQLNVSVIEKPRTNFQMVVNKEFKPEKLKIATILGEEDLNVREGLTVSSPPTCEDKNIQEQEVNKIRKLIPIGTIFTQNLALTGQLNNKKGLTQNLKSPFISPDKKTMTNFDLNSSQNILDRLRKPSTNTMTRPSTTSGPISGGSTAMTRPSTTSGPVSGSPSVMTRPEDPESSTAMTRPTTTTGNVMNRPTTNLTKADFDLVPNQIRSLMLSKTAAVANKWGDMDFDLVRDVETSEFYRYNYDMISKVEMLTGYELNGQNLHLMMSPQFRLLTLNDLENLKTGQVILCRTARYTNERLGIGISAGIDIKFFDEYFLISKAVKTLRSSPRKKTKSVNNILGLSKKSVGAIVLNTLNIETEEDAKTSPGFRTNMMINQRLKTKLDIL